jgi:hypothetical protein
MSNCVWAIIKRILMSKDLISIPPNLEIPQYVDS